MKRSSKARRSCKAEADKSASQESAPHRRGSTHARLPGRRPLPRKQGAGACAAVKLAQEHSTHSSAPCRTGPGRSGMHSTQ